MCHSCSFYLYRRLQGIQVQPTLSKMRVCTVKTRYGQLELLKVSKIVINFLYFKHFYQI
jgi:hypothetical protein